MLKALTLKGYSAEAQDTACLGLILSPFMEGMIRISKAGNSVT